MHAEAPPVKALDPGGVRRIIVRKLGIFSVAKVAGLVYSGIGLLIGAVFSVISTVGSVIGSISQGEAGPLLGLLFGVGAIIFFPLFYGVMGFLVTALGAAVYNLAASLVGGIEIEIE